MSGAAEGPAAAGPPKQRVLGVLERFFAQRGGYVEPEHLVKLMRALHSDWPDEDIAAVIAGLPREADGRIGCKPFVAWLYGSGEGSPPSPPEAGTATGADAPAPPAADEPTPAAPSRPLAGAAAGAEAPAPSAADGPTPAAPSRPLAGAAAGAEAPAPSAADEPTPAAPSRPPADAAAGAEAPAPSAADEPTPAAPSRPPADAAAGAEAPAPLAADEPTPAAPSRPSNRASQDTPVEAIFELQLRNLMKEHPYIEPGCSIHPHPLQYWIQLCRECVEAKKFAQAQDHLRRARNSLETDKRQIGEAFRRFDVDKSGHLDAEECRHMCAYLGWSIEEGALMGVDKEGKVTLPDFQLFIGRMGGVQHFFEHRRLRISASRRDVCDHSGIAVGARVRAHFYVRGQKSRSWREAVVTAVGVERRSSGVGPATYGVQLEFGFGAGGLAGRRWRSRQVVPPSWVLSGVEDASVAAAMREVGILSEHHAFWELLLPNSEMQAVDRLEPCQRNALTTVRTQATKNHLEALPKVRERFEKLGFGEKELQAVLGWVQDLAPVVVHVHLDRVGQFMEVDEFYRNQFETKTSCGALDPENKTRTGWEHELFGGAYDGAKPFDRCKYGALNVMNDYRGVVRARGYGDSYLVLKDVRLRCTFASTDSGGLAGSRLAVLDHYAHVLAEYNDEEIRGLVGVSMANANGENGGVGGTSGSSLKLLRGPTDDPGMDWITLGFPGLARQSGSYFFEVALLKDSSTPQVGFLSTAFELKPRAASSQGVGDDEHGWAADGQNAALWHGGQPRAWGTLWPHETRPVVSNTKLMTEDVVVGVRADLDARKIWFAHEGVWDEEPAFDAEDIPSGVSLYPAISLKGRAAFNFGPSFAHPLPEELAKSFARWPGAPEGKLRCDNPRLGNEEKLSIYKEVQIHGEVSLKRNVQRLVACQKYREAPKVNRAWALRVANAGTDCNGLYKRSGAYKGMPLYKSPGGAVIYCDTSIGCWRINGKEEFDAWAYSAPATGSRCEEPPRSGWQAPDDQCGVLAAGPLRRALQAAGVDEARSEALLAALGSKGEKGEELVFRVRGGTSLQAEWARHVGTEGPRCTAEEVWAAGVAEMQRELLQESGYQMGTVIESSHPYEAKRHEWRREVRFEGAEGITVNFCSGSCTLDGRTRLRIFTGGLSREAAGAGARVEVPLPGGDKVWGTVVQRGSNGASWRVRLDRHKLGIKPDVAEGWPEVGELVEGQYKTGAWHKATIVEVREDGKYLLDWYDGLTKDREKPKEQLRRPSEQTPDHRNLEDVPRYASVPKEGVDCFATCLENPAKVAVLYSASVGDEIAAFSLHRDCPLMPLRVEGFKDKGPAQAAGVQEGWYLDLAATVAGPSGDKLLAILDGLGGVSAGDSGDAGALLDAAFGDVEELSKRLHEKLLASTDVMLAFTDSCSPSKVALLPQAHVSYRDKQKIGEEIKAFTVAKKKLHVKSFACRGPAQTAGVRTDWLLDLDLTLNHNPGLRPSFDEDTILADPNILLTCSGVTLVFTQPHPTPTQRLQASGQSGAACWSFCSLHCDFAEFVFSTDGDGGSQPDQRWGVWALVLPQGGHDPWAELRERAKADAEEEIKQLRVSKAEAAAKKAAEEEEEKKKKKKAEEEALAAEEADRQGEASAASKAEGEPESAAPVADDTPRQVVPRPVLVTKATREQDLAVAGGAVRQSAMREEARLRAEAEAEAEKKRVAEEEEAREKEKEEAEKAKLAGEEAEKARLAEEERAEKERQEEEAEVRRAAVDRAIGEAVDAFAARWHEATQRAKGSPDQPEVQRGGWDEARLRSLCARHGWEFEWMTEDGERRRRAQEVWDPKAVRVQECMVRPFEADTMIPDGSTPVEAS